MGRQALCEYFSHALDTLDDPRIWSVIAIGEQLVTLRTSRLQLYFTPEERVEVIDAARRASAPLAVWLRQAALEKARAQSEARV